jgi:Rieske 2Fe-2S family protein
MSLWGIFGRPFVDLEGALDLSALDALDAEVTRGLSHVETTYTGGTLKWMGVVAPWAMDDDYHDAMHVIEALPDSELEVFFSLADDPSRFRIQDRKQYRFGDETDHPFNAAQQRWLTYRHGAYFPWKVCYHLLENERWEDKHSGEGKRFGDEAREVFPETVRYLEDLPFAEIGRAVIFGLQPNDHAPLHRDSEPGKALSIAQSISLCPRANKRFFLQNEADAEPLVIDARRVLVQRHGLSRRARGPVLPLLDPRRRCVRAGFRRAAPLAIPQILGAAFRASASALARSQEQLSSSTPSPLFTYTTLSVPRLIENASSPTPASRFGFVSLLVPFSVPQRSAP